MQMALIIIGGYVVASSPPVYALILRLAAVPKTPKSAVVLVAAFSMLTSLISWGFSLVISGILVRVIVRNVPRVDYRAISAAGYLGTGTVWALGLSSSAALLMATPASIPATLFKISGVIPLRETIYSWPSLATAAISHCGFDDPGFTSPCRRALPRRRSRLASPRVSRCRKPSDATPRGSGWNTRHYFR